MFLFESSKQKAIRQDVEKSMETCISNPKKYNEAKDILVTHLRGSQQKIIEMIVDNVKATIKNDGFQPIRKYQAILLLKDLMQTQNKALGKYVAKKILKRLTILAQHKSGTKDYERQEERGKDIFGPVKKDQQQYAVKFFNTLLTALQQWGKNWPKAPDGPHKDFHREYNALLLNEVQFPKQRPKQLRQSTGVSGARIPTREQIRGASTDQTSKPKSKSQEKITPTQPQPKPKPLQNSKIKNTRTDLDKFYQNTKQPLYFLIQLLPQCSVQSLPVIVDIVGQIQKNIEAGNQFVIEIQTNPNFAVDSQKLQKCFQFIVKIQKDLKILTKKPEQIGAFKNKYTKLTNQLLQFFKKANQQLPPSRIQDAPPQVVIVEKSRPPPPPQAQRKSPTPQMKQVKPQQPKIKNLNRYASVQGNQVLQNFSKQDFQSNSGQSVHSDRFGSFGGPTTERHRASIPIQQPTSPQLDKNKQKSNSDRKSEEQEKQKKNQKEKEKGREKKKQFSAIAEEKTLQLTKNMANQQKNNVSSLKPIQEFQIPFQQIAKVQKQKNQQNLKKSNTFQDNNSFGIQKFAKQQQHPQQQDFFAKIQKNTNDRDAIQNRRKKNPPKQEQDFFNAKIPSHIDSSKLSAFQFSQKGIDNSKNITNPPKKQVTTAKKIFQQNPFSLDSSQQKEPQVSNFFDNLNPNKSNSEDFFGKSTVTQKVNTQNDQNQQVQPKIPADNPFSTGNFGNMPDPHKIPIQNPFEKSSIKSKHSSSKNNPFGNQSFDKISKKSKEAKMRNNTEKSIKNPIQNENQNPIENNPFQSKLFDNSNFFDSKINVSAQAANPFQTSTHKSQKSSKSNKNPFDQVQDFFKIAKRPSIDGKSERNSLKNNETQKKTDPPLQGNLGLTYFGEPLRDSLHLSAKLDSKKDQNVLNFSQFQDIAEPKRQNKQIRTSDPFNFSGDHKENHQFSGFSLSNFPPIGQTQPNINQKQTQLNGSATDFFAKFQKQSIHSRKSVSKNVQKEKPQVLEKKQKNENVIAEKPQKNLDFFVDVQIPKSAGQKELFQNFHMDRSFSNNSKSQHKKSLNQNPANYNIGREKTVLSGEQKSFDFAQLDKFSAIQKKGKKQNDFDVFTQWGQAQNNTKRSVKDGFQFDNKSQKQLSWGDFDKQSPKQKLQSKLSKQQNQVTSNKSLEVESRLKVEPQQIQKPKQSKPASRVVNKLSNQNSLQLNLEDFAPITKKGIQWNPLGKISNLKSSPFIYNVDDKKIQLKKKELLQKQKNYNQKLEIFRYARQENQKIRNMFLQKMKKVEQVLHQRSQYEQILKKIKEANNSKQTQIQQINQKIKKTTQLKQKILQKQKQFYEITKNQIDNSQRKALPQRTMASKWQMFNKNLQLNRNSMYTMQSQYTNGY